MSLEFYHVLHLFSLFILVGFSTAAALNPVKEKKKIYLMATGIAATVVLITGIGMSHKMGYGFPGWVIGKIICWLALSVAVSLSLRVSSKVGMAVTYGATAIALFLVYYK